MASELERQADEARKLLARAGVADPWPGQTPGLEVILLGLLDGLLARVAALGTPPAPKELTAVNELLQGVKVRGKELVPLITEDLLARGEAIKELGWVASADRYDASLAVLKDGLAGLARGNFGKFMLAKGTSEVSKLRDGIRKAVGLPPPKPPKPKKP
jgi:hypothetical protein